MRGESRVLAQCNLPVGELRYGRGVLVWASACGSVEFEDVPDFLETLGPLPSVSIGEEGRVSHCLPLMPMRGAKCNSHCITKHKSRRIAFIRGPENHYSAQDRYRLLRYPRPDRIGLRPAPGLRSPSMDRGFCSPVPTGRAAGTEARQGFRHPCLLKRYDDVRCRETAGSVGLLDSRRCPHSRIQ